jgi:hypothetical protein
VRTGKEDIALIGVAGWWEGERDPLLNAVYLLLIYANRRDRPLANLHKLANAIERGDEATARKHYDDLSGEVEVALSKYPDVEVTLNLMLQMTDEELAHVEGLLQERVVG